MEIDLKTVFAGIAVFISVLSYFKAKRSLEYSQKQHEENKAITLKEFILSKSEFYIDLYNTEYLKINKLTGELSTLCASTNTNIGLLFDHHENNFRNEESGFQKALRHVYDETHKLIMESFKDEISWQTPENLYWRLAYFKKIDISLGDEEDINNYIKFNQKIKQGIFLLSKSIDKNRQQELYDDFLKETKSIVNFLEKISKEVKVSIENLENGLQKNKIENFDLQQNYKVYRLYKQLLNFLKLIDQSRINSLQSYERDPYLPISKIVYIGANMSILNQLIFRVSGSYWED